LWQVLEPLGIWGQRWANQDIGPDDADPNLLIWDMRRRIHLDRLPARRVVVQFDFTGTHNDHLWLVLHPEEVSVCKDDPGFDVDLLVTCDTLAMHRIWIGHLTFPAALRRGLVRIEGPRELARAFPGWLQLSMFAHVVPAQSPASVDEARARDGAREPVSAA
jgi:hypothetical protein